MGLSTVVYLNLFTCKSPLILVIGTMEDYFERKVQCSDDLLTFDYVVVVYNHYFVRFSLIFFCFFPLYFFLVVLFCCILVNPWDAVARLGTAGEIPSTCPSQPGPTFCCLTIHKIPNWLHPLCFIWLYSAFYVLSQSSIFRCSFVLPYFHDTFPLKKINKTFSITCTF